jgi:hypothetical protein
MEHAIRQQSRTWLATAAAVALTATLMFVIQPWHADAAPGDMDTTTVALNPGCRLAATVIGVNHVGPNTTFGPGAVKTFQGTGTTTGIPSTSPTGNCTIPSTAVGLNMTVTALGAPGTDSNMAFWAGSPTPKPVIASINPGPGLKQISVSTPLSSTGSFQVYNDSSTVDLFIDVVSYDIKSSLTELNSRLSALETRVNALPQFPTCNGTTPPSNLTLNGGANQTYDLRMTGGTPGSPAVYSGQINLTFNVLNGAINTNNANSQNNTSPMTANGTMTGSFATSPQTMGTTWNPANRGVFVFENVKILANGKDFCGTYRVIPSATQGGPNDFGTFTMTN